MKNLFKSTVFFCMISTLSIQAQGNEIANLYQQLISVFGLFDSAIKTSTSGKIPSPPPGPTGKIPSPTPVATKLPEEMETFFDCVKDVITYDILQNKEQFKLSQDVSEARKCVAKIDTIELVLKQAQDVIKNPQLSAVAKKRMKTALLLFSFALVRNFLNQFYINYQQNTVIYKGRYEADSEGLPKSENMPTDKLTVEDLNMFQTACSLLDKYAKEPTGDFEALDPGLIQQVLNVSKYLVNNVCAEAALMKKFEIWQEHVPVRSEHASPIEEDIKTQLFETLQQLTKSDTRYEKLLPRLVQLIYRTSERKKNGIREFDKSRLEKLTVPNWATNFSGTFFSTAGTFIEQEQQKQKELLKKLQEAPESKKREAFDRYAQVAVFKSESDFKKAVEEYLEKLSPQQVKAAQQKEKEREQEKAKQKQKKEDRYEKLKNEFDAWLARYKKGPGEYNFEKVKASEKKEMYNKAKEVNELAADIGEQRYPANIILRLK